MSLFPQATTNGNAGLFADPTANGLVQGQDYSDPSTVWRLRGGILDSAETLPIWGGVAVYQNVPGGAGNPVVGLGPSVGRATTVTGSSKPIMGWTVFQQNYAWVNSPSSTAPQGAPGQSVNYYPIGSLARIALACDPVLVDLVGGLTNAGVAWDFNNQMLIPFTGNLTVSSGTYNTSTGVATVTLSTSPQIGVGDTFELSSLTGTGAFASLDGTWEATAVVGDVVTFQAPASLGAATITGGTFATGVSLATLQTPFNVLDVQTSNCVTVGYNATSGATNYEFSGACALCQI